MNQVTKTVKAWISSYQNIHPSDLEEGRNITSLSFTELDVDMTWAKWTFVGEATITLTISVPKEDMVAERVKALREELSEVRAKHATEVQRIEDKIHKMLAIAHEPATSADPF